jgi:hypothetical protein
MTHRHRCLPTILPVLACLVGCSGDASPTEPGPGPASPPPSAPPPPISTFSVRGTVVDSLTTLGVEGATVQIADLRTTSDFAGFYQLDGVSEGTHALHVISTVHMPFSADLSVRSNTIRNVRLWRLTPFLESLTVDDFRTTATWIDLDGDFPSQSWARVTGTGSVIVFGSSSSQQVTPTARSYFFPSVTGAGKIEVELIDLAGHRGLFTCLPAWICVEE